MKKISVYEEIEEAKKTKAATLQDLHEKLANCEADLKKAKADGAAALDAGKVDAYTKAKEAGRTAEDQIEFYKIQIKDLEEAELFKDPTERRVKATAIKAAFEAVKEDKLTTAAQLLKDACALIEDVRKEANKGNDALTTLATNTGKNGGKIDVMGINGLGQRVHVALDHADIKPYIK